jgi:hypothetical protein
MERLMSTAAKSQKANPPSYDVFTVTGEGEAAFWTKIGAAWPNADGLGFNVTLAALPLNGRLVLRKPKPKSDAPPDAGQPEDVLATDGASP